MTKNPASPDVDPPRWTDRAAGIGPEDRAAERLRGARSLPVPALGYLRLQGGRRNALAFLPLARAATVLIVGVGIGVAGASGGWLARVIGKERSAVDRLEVSTGAIVRWHRHGRGWVALAGPGAATLDGDTGTVRLSAGTLTVAADEHPVAVEVGSAHFNLEPGAVASLAPDGRGHVDAIAVDGRLEAAVPPRAATGLERATAWHALYEGLSDPGIAAPPAEPPTSAAPVPVFAPRPFPAPMSTASSDARPERPRAVEPTRPPPVPAAASVGDVTNVAAARAALAPPPAASPTLVGNSNSEWALLGRALVVLRRDGDPSGALALLDQYSARFPTGALLAEVAGTRIEALLASGEEARALDALEALPKPGVPLDRRLRILRAEMRAKTGRCAEASRDFSEALHATPSDSVDERALRGRAACAALTHDERTLRGDLDAYLQHFPDRPFASEARLRREALRARP